MTPVSTSLFTPATEAADAGSTPMPSFCARSRCIASISPSVTASAQPPVFRIAASAFSALTGAPMRIAVATVSGLGSGSTTGSPSRIARTTGADPSAWMPVIMGIPSMSPICESSTNPLYTAEIFPAFPTGSTTRSGVSRSWSRTSNPIVFCPSSLNGFTEFRR